LPEFFTVTVVATEVKPTGSDPKRTLLLESVTCGADTANLIAELDGSTVILGAVPFPATGTMFTGMGALEVTVTSAVAIPATVGVKVAVTVQAAPADNLPMQLLDGGTLKAGLET
jgi:hypothetical protein